MSRWLADELHITLEPTQVGCVRVQRSLGLKGITRLRVASKSEVNQQDLSVPGWGSALKTMEQLLSQHQPDRCHVTLLLSNHFVRYALLPWSELIASDEQQLAYARHCFKLAYGDEVSSWSLRSSRANVGESQLASAVDSRLLAACAGVVKNNGMSLTSVQPHLMSAYNQFIQHIHEPDAWFALAETGNLCLARLHRGQWMRFRSARLGSSWDEFARFLGRVAFMDDVEVSEGKQVLYLYAPHLGRPQAVSGWDIRELPAPMTSSSIEVESGLVLALHGVTNA